MKCLLGKALSPTIYFLLAILQILQYCCSAEAGSIDIAPVTQHANLSESNYAKFHCRATGLNTRWNIHTQYFESRNYTEDGYVFSEVILPGVRGNILVHDMYLEVPTTLQYNRTVIKCVVFVDRELVSEPVLLIVQGGPAAPVPVLGVVNSSVLVLQWEAPFTWPYTSIHHYTITANNSLENWNQTVYTDTLVQIRASGRLTECTAYTFTVVANNEIADGIAGTVTGGFPIAPRMPAEPITEMVTFTSDQQPIIHLKIKLPMVCAYQQVRYQLTLRGPDSEILYQDGPHNRFYGDGEIVTYIINDLPSVTFIHATVRFGLSEMDNFTSDSVMMASRRNFSVTLFPVTNPQTEGVANGGTGFNTEQVVLIAAVGGALLLIAAVFIVVIAAVCGYRKRGRFGASGLKSPPMVTNPIYEGQSVYETIDPHFRPISLTSSHLPPPTPTSTRPLMESPYSHAQVDPSYATPQLTPSVEEAYTVMTSAGSFTKVSPEDSNSESNLDQRSSDMARYVPEPSMLASEC